MIEQLFKSNAADSKAHAFPLHHPGRKPCLRPAKDGIDGCGWYCEEVWGLEVSRKSSDTQELPRGALALSSIHQPKHFGPKVTFRMCKHPRTSVSFKNSKLTHNYLKLKVTLIYSPVEPSNICISLTAISTQCHRGKTPVKGQAPDSNPRILCRSQWGLLWIIFSLRASPSLSVK